MVSIQSFAATSFSREWFFCGRGFKRACLHSRMLRALLCLKQCCECAHANLTGVNIVTSVFCPGRCFFARFLFCLCLVFPFFISFGSLLFLLSGSGNDGLGRPNKANNVVWRLNFLVALIFIVSVFKLALHSRSSKVSGLDTPISSDRVR